MSKKVEHVMRKNIFVLILVLLICFGVSLKPQQSYAAAQPSFLFVGNSLTFYNNMPSMLQQMIATGKGVTMNYTATVYSGRTLQRHADAFAQIKSSKGNASNLTSAQKKTDITPFTYGSDKGAFNSTVYANYANAIWNTSTNKPKTYNYVVLQATFKNGEGDSTPEKIADAVSRIIKVMNSSSTTYVINLTWPHYKGTDAEIEAKHATVDNNLKQAMALLKNDSSISGKYKKILMVNTSRAFRNYLYYTGTNRAQNIEPNAYSVYAKDVINDLVIADQVHPTQLGSYLEACCIYSAIYGNASGFSKTYTGASKTQLTKVNNTAGTNSAMSYNSGNGLKNNIITQQLAFLADATIKNGMVLTSKADATAWKNNSAKTNYNGMNTAYAVFDGNGAATCTFKKQTYTYGVGSQKFVGTASRPGYKHEGWALTATATTAKYPPNHSVSGTWKNNVIKNHAGTIKLYAVWTKVANQKITLNKQSGTGGSSSVTATYDKALTDITVPSRTGYKFSGYYTGTNGTGTQYYNASGKSVITTAKLESALTLYAYWVANTNTVTLNQQNGSGGTTSVTSTYNSAMPKITVPSRNGYVFEGYYTEANGTGTQYYKADGTSARNWDKTANTTLYAKWSYKNGAIYWNVGTAYNTLQGTSLNNAYCTGLISVNSQTGFASKNGVVLSGSYNITTTKYDSWNTTTLFAPPVGYQHASEAIQWKIWNATKMKWISAGASAAQIDFTSFNSTNLSWGDTLYFFANWQKTKYTIAYNLNGGTNHTSNPSSYDIETNTITLSNPYKTGHIFGGWYLDSSYKTKISTIPKGSTGNQTLYAYWIPDYPLGDVNYDWTIDTDDVFLILKYYSGSIDKTKLNLNKADVDKNNIVNSDDAVLVLKYYAGIITRFPN